MQQQEIAANMEALVWRGPGEIALYTEPTPQLAPAEVLLSVDAVGICGSEISGYLGQSSIRKPPLIMGHEAAGRIVIGSEALMANGDPAQAGTRVTFNPLVVCGTCDRCRAGLTSICRKRQLIGAHRPGAFARYVAVPAQQCWPLPNHLSSIAGSLTEPLACAVRAVSRAQVRRNDTLLILGAGPIGLCCLAAARAAGIERVLVSDLAPRRLEVAQRWGAHTVIPAREHDVIATTHEVVPGGVDAVIDAVGANVTRAQAVQTVVPGGQVVFIGLHDEESPLAANYLVRQEVTITGTFAYTEVDFKWALDLLDQKVVQAEPDWLEVRPLDAGPEAFEELVAGTAEATKIVLKV